MSLFCMVGAEQPEEVKLPAFLGSPEPAKLVQFGFEFGEGSKCRSLGVSLPFDSLSEFVEAGAYVAERLKLHAALPLESFC